MLNKKITFNKNNTNQYIEENLNSISLIGMPGSGKTTLAKALSQHIGWAFVDTDYILEAWYGLPLEYLINRLGRDNFLRAEEQAIIDLNVTRTIIATGGSVIYSEQAMQKLKFIGRIIYLQADLHTIDERVAKYPQRGLVCRPDQTLEDIYEERTPRYSFYADLTIQTNQLSLQECLSFIQEWMYEKKEK